MLPYTERMQREAARLRAAVRLLEHENALHKAVSSDQEAVRRGADGRWITVRRGLDLSRHHVLSRELRAVEAKLDAAQAQGPDFEVPPTDDELRATLPPEALVPVLVDAAASLDHDAAEAARKRQSDRAAVLQQERDELLAEAVALAGEVSAATLSPAARPHVRAMRA
jgi:hypothetical protein